MKKHFFMALTAAAALASCSSDEAIVDNGSVAEGNVPVAFDSYLGRQTRATAITTNASIQAPGKGFGVFAYDQDNQPVETYTKSFVTPNFFNNQQLTYNAGNWEYSNIKYWPNNPGAMLSFYAYAPYMADLPTDPVTTGCRLVLSGANNGPAIQYIMPKDLTEAVDLCWGQEYGKELAPVNKEKPSITDKTKFNFKHAMARYGFNIQVWSDAMTDNYPHDPTDHEPAGDGNNDITPNTTIKVESVKLIGTFAKEGVLRLYDGTWDAQIATTSEYELAPNFSSTVNGGLTLHNAYEEIPLFSDDNTYVMMIPGGRFKIQIKYTVTTIDASLVGGKHVKTNTLESELFTAEEGVATDFHLNLGMTTVKFDAVVTDWNNAADKEEVDLPANALEEIVSPAMLTTQPTNMDGHFLGKSTVVPAGADDDYYYNLGSDVVAPQLYKKEAGSWVKQTTGIFLANSELYYCDGTRCDVIVAPKWINTADNGFYMLTNGVYVVKGTAITSYDTIAKLVAANPTGEKVYLIGGKYYYYVHQ